MLDTGLRTREPPFQVHNGCAGTNHHALSASSADYEQLLVTARPRLLRLTRLCGVPFDVAEDVVQETLLEAWSHLENLRAPDRFDAWLDGICRNMCRRWIRWQRTFMLRHERFPALSLYEEDTLASTLGADVFDPLALDPVEELCHQDLKVLLGQALKHLPQSAREAVELCYLVELPQKEAAIRLGIPLGALEERLRRARRHLHQILSGELRAEAEAFGIGRDQDFSAGWRETHRWCNTCGRHHLRGLLEPLSNGRVNLRLRCPDCSQCYHTDDTNVEILTSRHGLHSFRPAIKRTEIQLHSYYAEALAQGQQICLSCNAMLQVQIVSSDEFSVPIYPHRFYAALNCSRCGLNFVSTAMLIRLMHPVVQQFVELHPRWIHEPDMHVEYAGQSAIRVRMVDLTSAAQLMVFIHNQTLQVLASFEE